jgi:hypothetical protein
VIVDASRFKSFLKTSFHGVDINGGLIIAPFLSALALIFCLSVCWEMKWGQSIWEHCESWSC